MRNAIKGSGRRSNKPAQSPAPAHVGPSQAVRDIFVAAINKGQLPFAIMGAFALLLLWKLPSEEVAPLVKWMLNTLSATYLAGYMLFATTLLLWFFHAQRIRREYIIQMDALRAVNKKTRQGEK